MLARRVLDLRKASWMKGNMLGFIDTQQATPPPFRLGCALPPSSPLTYAKECLEEYTKRSVGAHNSVLFL